MRPIKLGDDLSGKTIYLDLPDELSISDYFAIEGDLKLISTKGMADLTLIDGEGRFLDENIQLKKTYTLPENFGIVTYISDTTDGEIYLNNIKISDDSHDTYFAICENLCLEETLTKEQLPYFYIPRSEMLDYIYPVGSIIENENKEFDPNHYYGGTWERIKGKVIVGVDEDDADFATAGNAVGEKKHTLSVNEIPSHGHSVVLSANNHRLTMNTAENSGSTYKVSYDNASASNNGPFITASNAGGGKAHNNIQPSYIAYIWRRVA